MYTRELHHLTMCNLHYPYLLLIIVINCFERSHSLIVERIRAVNCKPLRSRLSAQNKQTVLLSRAVYN